jgi:hypothetical protein
MNVDMNGAARRRPKLSLHYGASRETPRPPAAPTLPDHEVRRLVAGMIG